MSASSPAQATRQCKHCGRSFSVPPSAENKKFCSAECRAQWWHERRRKAELLLRSTDPGAGPGADSTT
jgi:predicted nucleic acid-binding Zn ribbon protein